MKIIIGNKEIIVIFYIVNRKQRTWQQQYDYCRANNGGMNLVALESNPEEKAIHAAWTTSKNNIYSSIF